MADGTIIYEFGRREVLQFVNTPSDTYLLRQEDGRYASLSHAYDPWPPLTVTEFVHEIAQFRPVQTDEGVTLQITTPEPSPTPAVCSPLPEGLTFTVTPISDAGVTMELTGLQPGEEPYLIFIQDRPDGEYRAEEWGMEPADENGRFFYKTNLSSSYENPDWQIKVIHAHGVVCTEIKMPPEATAVPAMQDREIMPLLATSPDSQWQVTTRASDQVPPEADETEQFPNGKFRVEMLVEHVDGSQTWTAVAEWRGWGLGLTYPEPVRWSVDGRFFYFANVPVPDGCSIFVNGGNLWRLDLDSGAITEVAPYIGLVMALSPDETKLAVNASYGRGFLIRDLATGDEQSIPLPQPGEQWKPSGLKWSPDGQHLLLTQATNPCSPGETKTAVVRIDVDDLSATTILEPDERNFTLLEWVQNNEVRLRDASGRIWFMDVFSGELALSETAVTPNPSAIKTGAPILFLRDNDLWRADLNGQNEQRLTTGQLLADWGIDKLPAFDPWWAGGFPPHIHISPDGRWLAFTQTGRNLVLVDVTGAQSPRFHKLEGWAMIFTWSPDSQRLAYSIQPHFLLDRDQSGIYVYDVVTGRSDRLLSQDGGNLVWSPDSRFLAFSCCFSETQPGPTEHTDEGEVRQVELTSRDVITVGETWIGVASGPPTICWSADGTVGIEVIEPVTCSFDPQAMGGLPGDTRYAYFFIQSPDDEHFHWLGVKDIASDDILWEREVPLVQRVHWSPDGQYLILGNNFFAGDKTIWRMTADGEEVERLLPDALLLDVVAVWEKSD